MPGVFRDHGGAMSTDWSKYSTPIETQQRAPKPWKNSVISFPAGSPRSLELTVEHTPDLESRNRAHASVIGDKKRPTWIRYKLTDSAKVVLHHSAGSN